MRRRLIQLGLFVLLGAIVNVAVAWGLALFVPMRYSISHSGMFYPTDTPNWDVAVIWRAGAVLIDAEASDTMARQGPIDHENIPSWSVTLRSPTNQDARRNRALQEIAYGWPSISLYERTGCCTWTEGALVVPWFSRYDKRMLPLIPIWPGFLLNTLLYGSILYVGSPLFAAPFALRRRRRIKRGLCPACAYPVGDSPVCTECGADVMARPVG